MSEQAHMHLRDYQLVAKTAIVGRIVERKNGLVVMPTGAGKTVVIGAVVEELIRGGLADRIAVVTHSVDLVEQTADGICSVFPDAPIGIVSAGLKRREHNKRITVGNIQTLHGSQRRASLIWKNRRWADQNRFPLIVCTSNLAKRTSR